MAGFFAGFLAGAGAALPPGGGGGRTRPLPDPLLFDPLVFDPVLEPERRTGIATVSSGAASLGVR